ncbi:hypothetical protein CfE428DRAFT_3610 [Chthoniobacter flavus Ellin428]|uniref:Uncharacterized protein n=1 Tax=Chthoniobacter flavus Ellin428 TaxID=497964 RepID=B4D3X2_9BACT|nr:hypothetical protein CfE428DRAFT_3610 [Chthoniobacter flavus Ellin428]TCO93536.1 hypothetical protein EV701_104240 [Chthoniobacter flavus]
MFHLYCDSLNSHFTLCQEGESWQLTFESFEDAYEQAEARATGEVRLVLHNANGAVIYQTTISPLEPALLKARAHWKEVARGEREDKTEAWRWPVEVRPRRESLVNG